MVEWMGRLHLYSWTFLQLLLIHFTTSEPSLSALLNSYFSFHSMTPMFSLVL